MLEEQRESLRAALKDQTSVADQVYAIRHALMQTEQNTGSTKRRSAPAADGRAVQSGEGFCGLFGNAGSRHFMGGAVPAGRKAERQGVAGGADGAFDDLQRAVLLFPQGIALGWVSALAALIAGSAALLTERRKSRSHRCTDEVRVTLQPDVERLLARCWTGSYALSTAALNDFAYLNDSSAEAAKQPAVPPWLERACRPDGGTFTICGGEVPEAGRNSRRCGRAARTVMGLTGPWTISEETSRLFTVLPSKNETRTISPAIVSAGGLSPDPPEPPLCGRADFSGSGTE